MQKTIKTLNINTLIRLMTCFVLAGCFLLPQSAWAHRGAKNEVDTCRFSVGDDVIHFTAYTPQATGGQGFCHQIPNVGMTHLVFDYEGTKLRETTVEFEITKEPEGVRIFYQEPKVIKKGSVDAQVDFSQHGAGEYLAHVTITYKGEKLDSHLPFSIGVEPDDGGSTVFVSVLLGILAVAVIGMVVMSRRNSKNSEA